MGVAERCLEESTRHLCGVAALEDLMQFASLIGENLVGRARNATPRRPRNPLASTKPDHRLITELMASPYREQLFAGWLFATEELFNVGRDARYR